MIKAFKTVLFSYLLTSNCLASDLLATYQDALKMDPKLQEARQIWESKQNLSSIAQGSLLPQISANYNMQSEHTEPSTSESSPLVRNYKANISITQSIFNLQKWYDLKEANLLVRSSKADLIAAEQELIIRVAKAYLNVLKAEDILEFKKTQKLALAKEREEVKEKLNVGLIAITDLNETEARDDNATAELIAAENDLADKKQELAEITTKYPEKLAKLKDNFTLLIPYVNLEQKEDNTCPSPLNNSNNCISLELENISEWVNTAMGHNPAIIAANDLSLAKGSSYKSKKVAHLPTISFSAAKGKIKIDSPKVIHSGYLSTWNASLNFSVNLYSGNTINAKSNTAFYDYQQSLAKLEAAKRATKANTEKAYRGVISSISRINALKQAVKSSHIALQASKVAYEVGTRTSVDVLNSIAELYKNKQLYTEAKHAYIINLLQLKQYAGVLSPQDLDMVNSWLEEA